MKGNVNEKIYTFFLLSSDLAERLSSLQSLFNLLEEQSLLS